MKEQCVDRRLRHAGCIGLLCECFNDVDFEVKGRIEEAVSDWCELTGWGYRVSTNKIWVFPPEEGDGV